ncbi:hypothetical protein NQ318_017624 [Aromia moschata]|uniref:DUF4817 domain-containing protein n=1 Tax=Aromia moschata TaxID=1265417 RepID=A0AAV8Z1E3_9CUCU|nr:hypothetical protein NQ318_017624 [Aromia moschata]
MYTIFNNKYPDRRISQSTVSRIENKFREFGNVTDIPTSGRKRILDDEQKLDILFDIQDNPHNPTRQLKKSNTNVLKVNDNSFGTSISVLKPNRPIQTAALAQLCEGSFVNWTTAEYAPDFPSFIRGNIRL